ncbi:hypothetical protein C0J52_09405 [Blattella germanica]|nr:hypothetical protein C0J52_09405 [Blattella germanica]
MCIARSESTFPLVQLFLLHTAAVLVKTHSVAKCGGCQHLHSKGFFITYSLSYSQLGTIPEDPLHQSSQVK